MKYICILLLMTGFMAGCIDDESTGADRAVSTLSFVSELEDAYTSPKNEEFVLAAPEVKQENLAKELTYEWQVNYEVVSTKAELRYLCEDCGSFDCRLKISNEDGAIFKEFKLNVPFPYEDGLLVLSSYDNRTMLSFKNLTPEEPFELDVFELNNHGLQVFGSTPKAIMYYSGWGVYVATENPTALVALEYNTMIAMKTVNYPLDGISGFYYLGGWQSPYVIGDGRILNFITSADYFSSFIPSSIYDAYPDFYASDKFTQTVYDYGYMYSPDQSIVYDENGNHYFNINYYGYTELCADLSKCSLVDMFGNATNEVVVIAKKADGGLMVHIENVTTAAVRSEWDVPASSGMTEDGVFLLRWGAEDLLYSNGNQIYIYNYGSDGNFPTTPHFTVGKDGDVVKDMIFDPNEEMLYVAVDAADGDYKGCIYCYDYASRQLLWSERGVAGEIVQILYKSE